MSREQTAVSHRRTMGETFGSQQQAGNNEATRCLRAMVLVVCALACSLAIAGTARADEAIRVVRDSYQVEFAQGITFHIELAAQKALERVTLYYRQVGEGLTVKVTLAVKPGQTAFEHTWALEPGDLPVGVLLEYYWRVADEAGDEMRTTPIRFSYDDQRFAWKPLTEGNVTLFWYGSDERGAQRLLGYALDSLTRLQDEMGVTVDQPLRMYIYNNKSDMSLALPRKSDTYDDRILTLGVVVDEGTLLILGSQTDVEQTIAHELAHVVVGLATDNPYAELPRWLDEGLAMYSEGELPTDNRREMEAAIRRDALISVRSLSGYTGDPEEVDLFYGEVYSVVDFLLRTYGREKMTQLLEGIRKGLYQEEALQQVYGFGLDELDKLWRESLGLGPRKTPTPSTTPAVQRRATRPSLPCPLQWISGLLALAVAASWRRHARAA